MFTITNKLRTVIAVGAVGAALASTGVASAATVNPGLDPGKVGGAVASDKECQDLVKGLNTLANSMNNALASGKLYETANLGHEVDEVAQTILDNCLVVD
jgi:hypothetical protein